MRLRTLSSAVVVCLAVTHVFTAVTFGEEPPEFTQQEIDFFEKEVRPILARRCYECHSADSKEIQGSLQVDSRAALIAGGDTGPAIVPGNAKESLLIDAINWGDIYQMPPKTQIPKEEIATLTKWVEMNAPWPKGDGGELVKSEFDLEQRKQDHWCWQPIQNPALPKVNNEGWVRDDLDRFILAKLEEKGLTPAVEADRRVLIRRVYFDLIGLPPGVEEVEAFVADTDPKAYEKVVDKLLTSERYGERWGRHWLDLVRYAESCGHEFDYPIPHAWRYRDYVIRALNDDVPYDQFVTEHLAGDLMKEPRLNAEDGTNESIKGTGFWWLGESVHSPVDVKGNEAGIIDNQIDVFSKTFLGVAVSCARCHDHKFDAISTKDYYAIAGFLQSSRRQEAILDPQGKIAAKKAEILALRAQGDELIRQIADQLAVGQKDDATFGKLLLAAQQVVAGASTVEEVAKQSKLEADKVQSLVAAITAKETEEKSHLLHLWRRLSAKADFSDPEAFQAEKAKILAEAEEIQKQHGESELITDFSDNGDSWFATGFAFDPDKHPTWDGSDQVRLTQPGKIDSGKWAPQLQGVMRSPTFTLTHRHIDYRVRGKGRIRLIIEGYDMDIYNGLLFGGAAVNADTKGATIWLRQGGDVSRYVGKRCHIEIIDHGNETIEVGEVRLTNGSQPKPTFNPLTLSCLKEAETLEQFVGDFATATQTAVQKTGEKKELTESEVMLLNWLLAANPLGLEVAPVQKQLADLNQQIDELAKQIPGPIYAQAIADGSAEDEHVFVRGNHKVLGPVVERRLLTAIGGEANKINSPHSGRMQLAGQVVDPANPLTARVIANRIWHHLMGRGIVPTVDNFGVLGQQPTHPELLDHLSTRMVQEGWSMKNMIREIVTSSTYRMDSAPSDAGTRIDPNNDLLHRMRIRRLEGEAIRDAGLKLAGRLNTQMFGDSVPVHLTAFMQGRGRPGSGPLDGGGRRSIYISIKRNFLNPMMLTFDTPVPFSTMGRRNTSNVPAQALILMNNPLIVDLSKTWGKNLVTAEFESTDARIEAMYLEAFSRPPTEIELASAKSFMISQGKEYGLPEDAAMNDARVWGDLCHVMMNVKEFIYIR